MMLISVRAHLSAIGIEEDDPNLIGTGQEHRSRGEEEQEQTQDWRSQREWQKT